MEEELYGKPDHSLKKSVNTISEENRCEGSDFIADMELSFQGLKFGILQEPTNKCCRELYKNVLLPFQNQRPSHANFA